MSHHGQNHHVAGADGVPEGTWVPGPTGFRDHAVLSDMELVRLVRRNAGTAGEAADVLWSRHQDAVRAYASLCVSAPRTADVLAGESCRTASAIGDAHVPQEAWRPHLLTRVLHTAVEWSGSERASDLSPDLRTWLESGAGDVSGTHDTAARPESVLLLAFRQLPVRTRTVLWHDLVEREDAGRIGRLLGVPASTVRTWCLNARERFRSRYIQVYEERLDGPCRGFSRLVVAATRLRDAQVASGLDGHIAECPCCHRAFDDLLRMQDHCDTLLAEGLLPWGGARYLAGRVSAAGLRTPPPLPASEPAPVQPPASERIAAALRQAAGTALRTAVSAARAVRGAALSAVGGLAPVQDSAVRKASLLWASALARTSPLVRKPAFATKPLLAGTSWPVGKTSPMGAASLVRTASPVGRPKKPSPAGKHSRVPRDTRTRHWPKPRQLAVGAALAALTIAVPATIVSLTDTSDRSGGQAVPRLPRPTYEPALPGPTMATPTRTEAPKPRPKPTPTKKPTHPTPGRTPSAPAVPGASVRWDFDEIGGGTTADDSGNGNTGILVGAPRRSGSRGGSLTFNGRDQYVEGRNKAVATDRSFTVAAWVKPASKAEFFTAVGQDGEEVSRFFLQYDASIDRWRLALEDIDSSDADEDEAVSETSPAIGTWVHLAGVYDAADDELRLYVNGRLEDTSRHTANWSADGAFTVGRGKWEGRPSDQFRGSIDDVRAFPRAVTPAEAAALAAG
ncbi:LamG-like jellyroll fold domain-containing protein [Streptomyces sp. NPDC051776]|uniref:LamG-like jellyroll fold domain-containing protein n=1 Tax=Streptomyces sp. NPDC051776 TaxID=3155414 RepID=UPI0034271A92